jgi:hypothetical protein
MPHSRGQRQCAGRHSLRPRDGHHPCRRKVARWFTSSISLAIKFSPTGTNRLTGNYAAVIATAEAHGADSLTATQTNALTVENQFSFVNAIAVVAV